jgi:diguanylate cyclase (GGDEF)-like protein/PAS domain S-box-containing protein
MGQQISSHQLFILSLLFIAGFYFNPLAAQDAVSPASLKQAHTTYYQVLNNRQLSQSAKIKQWSVLHQFLLQNDHPNLMALVVYQLALSAVEVKNKSDFEYWTSQLIEQDGFDDDSTLRYLELKLAQDWAYAQNEFEAAINIGHSLLYTEIETTSEPLTLNDEQLMVPLQTIIDINSTLGRAYYRKGNYIASQQHFLDALSLSEDIGDQLSMSKALNNLSVIAWGLDDAEKALQYLERGLKIAIELKDSQSIISKWSNKGIYHKQLEQLEQAQHSFNKALTHTDIKQYPKLEINTLLAIAELESELRNYQKSSSYAKRALSLSESIADEYSINSSKMVLAGLANELNQPSKAKTLYEDALAYFSKNEFIKEQSNALQSLSTIYQQLDKPEKALAFYKEYHQIYSKLQASESRSAVTKLQQEFEVDSRKKEIALLKKENQLKVIELESTEAQKGYIVTYGGLALLVVLLLISRFYSYKESKRLKLHAGEIEAREKQLLLLSHAFRSTSDGVWITDPDFIIEVVNDSFLKLTERADSVGRKMSFVHVMGQDQRLTEYVFTQIKSEGSWQGEAYDQRASGEIYPIEIKIESIKNDDGEILHYLGAFRDITHRKEAEKKLKQLVTHDELTGLPNRVLFCELIQRSFLNVEREKIVPVVLFVDVDGFKKLNDSLGHEAGDDFICQIADRLSATLRSKDIIARIGGDEFGVLVELGGENVEAGAVAQKLLNAFVKPFWYNERSYRVTVSIGVSVYLNDADEAEELIRKSDIAMNAAKQLGKNTFSFYQSHMNDEVVGLLEREQRIVNAIDNQLFEFFYQPIVDVTNNVIVGAEALIRWREPNGELVFPDQFIPLAEKSGIIEQIDTIVVDLVFKQMAQWNAGKVNLKHVSINLSARIFSQADKLISLLESKVEKYQIQPSQVKIEITEGMLIENIEQVIETMKRLKTLGFILAIDDFGTGFSSLNYLKQFPIDILKIDRSFIMDMHESPKNKSIVRTIVELAHNLEFNVIAEGVEMEAHLSTLAELGCEEFQGYYFSKPLEIDRFETLYAENKKIK